MPDILRFRVLGSLQVLRNGADLDLGPIKQQICLSVLLGRANGVTSVETLVEAIWGGSPPRTARKNVQVYVAGLRRLLGDARGGDRIIHRIGGYVLTADADELDHLRFDRLMAQARTAAHSGAAADLLAEALDLWSGDALHTVGSHPVLTGEVARLTGRHGLAMELWAEAELGLGNAVAVVERLSDGVARHPLRERLTELLMTALAHCGRQGEALAAYADLRQHLARELGLGPAAAVDSVYRQLLAGELPSVGANGDAVRATETVVLPADPEHFTGRSDEVAELVAALGRRSVRLAVVSGAVGIGKTVTAVRVAHRLGCRFPDGRVFLPLRTHDGTPRSAAAVLTDLLRLTGCPDPLHTDPSHTDELCARWHRWAATRRMLVVLDDAPNHAAVGRLLAPAGPAAFLVTSRSRLIGLEAGHRLDLGPLRPPDAVALLRRLTQDDRGGLEPVAACRIVEALGHHPLAVYRAGVRLGSLRHVTAAAFADRLESGRGVLAQLDTADGELRKRIRGSLTHLTDHQRVALAAHVDACSGCTAEEADALIEENVLCSTEPEVVAHGSGTAVHALPFLVDALLREDGLTGAS